jgi:hypothetical protein
MTQKEAVRKLLKSRKWTTTTAINRAAGSESGTRRARELREEGFILKTRNTGSETEYRIAGKA